MTESVLSARGVTVHVGRRPVLTDVDLDLRAGELVVLIGPNGAGKSTLLAVLAGDRAPSIGEVLLGGRPLRSHQTDDVARKRSVLTQSNDVTFPFRVDEVVRMGRAPWRRRPEAEQDHALVRAAMHVAEVDAFASRPVTELSGGERARVAFARSRAQNCEIALLDEPTASLDVRHQHRVLDAVSRHAAAGGSAIVVLHDLALAAAYADRIALLEDGVLVAVGTPREVLDEALLSRVYRHPISVSETSDGELIIVARRPVHPCEPTRDAIAVVSPSLQENPA